MNIVTYCLYCMCKRLVPPPLYMHLWTSWECATHCIMSETSFLCKCLATGGDGVPGGERGYLWGGGA